MAERGLASGEAVHAISLKEFDSQFGSQCRIKTGILYMLSEFHKKLVMFHFAAFALRLVAAPVVGSRLVRR